MKYILWNVYNVSAQCMLFPTPLSKLAQFKARVKVRMANRNPIDGLLSDLV